MHNAVAGLVFQEGKFCHVNPLPQSLHWLPVKYRINFKVLLLTFKAIHGLAPPYICQLISVRETGSYNLRCNNDFVLNYPTCKSLITLGDRSFYVAVPKLWNDLSYLIRNISSPTCFEKLH